MKEKRVSITVAVNLNGETKLFSAEATTESDELGLARGVLSAKCDEGLQYLSDLVRARRGF